MPITMPMPTPTFTGVIYPRGAPVHNVMRGFVEVLQNQGLAVHGVLQTKPKNLQDSLDTGCGVDAIDIQSGTSVALVRPSQYELDNGICSLDLSQLAEVSMILRRAIDGQADVVVVEKFGKHEKDGGGISSDLMAVIAEGIPTVVSVPESELESWNTFRGDMGELIPCELDALLAWWARVV